MIKQRLGGDTVMPRICWFIILCLCMITSACTAENEAQVKKSITIGPDEKAEYTCSSLAASKLNQEQIVVENGSSKAAVPVVLSAQRCSATFISPSGIQSNGRAYLYEIKANSDGATYSWSIALEFPASSVRVFSNVGGRSYVTVTSVNQVIVEDITRPRSRDEALCEVWTPRRVDSRSQRSLTPHSFVGREAFAGVDALQASISVRNLYVDSSGNLNIDIVGTDPEKVFTFVQRNGKWDIKNDK